MGGGRRAHARLGRVNVATWVTGINNFFARFARVAPAAALAPMPDSAEAIGLVEARSGVATARGRTSAINAELKDRPFMTKHSDVATASGRTSAMNAELKDGRQA